MEEQQKFDLKLEVVQKAPEAIQGKTEVIGKSQELIVKLEKREEQQTPIVWCGGGFNHDVTICLVAGVSDLRKLFMSKGTEHQRQILTKLMVHSSRLRKCSKYFETCLAERWKKPSSTSSLEFVLEMQADIACYTDCFSRMYAPPFAKDFKDVNYSLGLLKVASQIQFHELMDSVSLYLSSKVWSDGDEIVISLAAALPDFPRNHAQDLIVRLGMDESKEDCRKRLCDVIEQCIRTALAYDGNFLSNRALIREMLPGNHLNVCFSNCMTDVFTIVSREAKDMVVAVGKECEGKSYLAVPMFADKILAICWILEALLTAKVAEELVECFVHLHAFPKILAIESLNAFPPSQEGSKKKQRDARNAAVELAKLVLVIYQEVPAGNLLLKIPERIALLENWHSLTGKLLLGTTYNIDQATKFLFMTLPLKQQLEIVKARKDSNYESYITTNSLAMVLKKRWPGVTALSPPSSS